MKNKMSLILDCDAVNCAYNKGKKCHSFAVTIGGGECPLCDTSILIDKKGGNTGIIAGVGACKVDYCKYNGNLECNADGIHIKMHMNHAECGTFEEA